jgi:hypothetical protein
MITDLLVRVMKVFGRKWPGYGEEVVRESPEVREWCCCCLTDILGTIMDDLEGRRLCSNGLTWSSYSCDK